MPAPAKPKLTSGRVYRTKDFSHWTRNPTRLAKRLVREGQLRQLANGLYLKPKRGRFGEVPASDEKLMRGFLEDAPFVFTGSEYWNSLGLGSTSMSPVKLVYNTKRSGTFTFGSRRFWLRRMNFPRTPTPEWYVVDLLDHSEQVGVARSTLIQNLREALAQGRFAPKQLRAAGRRYGSKATQRLVDELALPAAE